MTTDFIVNPRDPAIVDVWLGDVFVGGRHSRGLGLEADAVKYAEALCLGYPVLRVTPRHIRQGQAVDWIQRYFGTEVGHD